METVGRVVSPDFFLLTLNILSGKGLLNTTLEGLELFQEAELTVSVPVSVMQTICRNLACLSCE